jgi:hypothetical protein
MFFQTSYNKPALDDFNKNFNVFTLQCGIENFGESKAKLFTLATMQLKIKKI